MAEHCLLLGSLIKCSLITTRGYSRASPELGCAGIQLCVQPGTATATGWGDTALGTLLPWETPQMSKLSTQLCSLTLSAAPAARPFQSPRSAKSIPGLC